MGRPGKRYPKRSRWLTAQECAALGWPCGRVVTGREAIAALPAAEVDPEVLKLYHVALWRGVPAWASKPTLRLVLGDELREATIKIEAVWDRRRQKA